MIKVILNGLGAVGQSVGRLIVKSPHLECVGAVDTAPAKVGKDLGEILTLDRKLGVKVSSSIDSIIAETSADIVSDASSPFLRDIQKGLLASIKAGRNYISACEELAYPVAFQAELAHEIDELAKSHSVTVLGTGTNPGFTQDLLPLVLTGACQEVESITTTRLTESSGLGVEVLRKFGLGETREEFDRRVREGSLIAHTGHPEQIVMVADALGWKIGNIERTLTGWVSKTRRQGAFFTAEPGTICNVRTLTTGYRESGEKAITMDLTLLFAPSDEAKKEDAADGLEAGDFLTIKGKPNIDAQIKGLANSVIVTSARIVNGIPYVVLAKPGLLSQKDFPPFVPVQ